ncbi:MAG: hypothetical protein ACI9HI_000417 [Salinirussus sp.]|jgi:hypothetical protein
MDRETLEGRLATEFGEAGLRAVSRQARDLADSGRVAEDLGFELTVDAAVSNLRDAPDDHTLVERWNWWVGALDLSHGGYLRFRVREDAVE